MAPGHEDKLCCSPNRVGHMRIIRTCLHGETALLHQRSLLQPRQANHVQWSVMAFSHVCNNVYRDQSSLPRAEACALHRKARDIQATTHDAPTTRMQAGFGDNMFYKCRSKDRIPRTIWLSAATAATPQNTLIPSNPFRIPAHSLAPSSSTFAGIASNAC